MSDLIRREDVLRIIRNGWSNHYSCKDMCDEINELPTVDEKEIIRKPFERVVERLEEHVTLERMNKMEDRVGKKQATGFCLGVNATIEIVKEEGGIE